MQFRADRDLVQRIDEPLANAISGMLTHIKRMGNFKSIFYIPPAMEKVANAMADSLIRFEGPSASALATFSIADSI